MSAKQKDKDGPDGLSVEELQQSGGTDYAYRDQTRDVDRVVPFGGQGDGVPSSVLNPAYYPAAVKPEELYTENEKAGASFPTGPKPEDVEDQSRTSEQIQQEYEAARPYLKEGSQGPQETEAEQVEAGRRQRETRELPPLKEENSDKL